MVFLESLMMECEIFQIFILKLQRFLELIQIMLLLKVVFPAALSQTFAGLRLAIGTAWMIIVAAEIIASKAGLGYILLAGRNFAQASIIFIGIALIGLLAFITDRIGRVAYMYVTRWMKRGLEV